MLGRRADGYHALQSLVAFADIGDRLTLTPGEDLALEIQGPFAHQFQAAEDNLVLQAARAAYQCVPALQIGRIRLEKYLPVASGLGGGSADAAATLRLLAEANQGRLPDALLVEIADALGSDIRVCLRSEAAWMEGRGERVAPVPSLPPLPAVLVNPDAAVATAEVFRLLGAAPTTDMTPAAPPAPFADACEVAAFMKVHPNDLEPAAMRIAPVIGDALAALAAQPGTLAARLSGSGATCFALFAEDHAAAHAAQIISAEQPNWWVVSTTLH